MNCHDLPGNWPGGRMRLHRGKLGRAEAKNGPEEAPMRPGRGPKRAAEPGGGQKRRRRRSKRRRGGPEEPQTWPRGRLVVDAGNALEARARVSRKFPLLCGPHSWTWREKAAPYQKFAKKITLACDKTGKWPRRNILRSPFRDALPPRTPGGSSDPSRLGIPNTAGEDCCRRRASTAL